MPTVSALPDNALDVLADLRGRFRERTRRRIAALGDALLGDRPDGAVIAPLAHQLAGSAGTFGYAELSRAAAALEDAARAAGQATGRLEAGRLQRHFLAVEAAFAALDSGGARHAPSAERHDPSLFV